VQEWHGARKNFVRKDWARNQAEKEIKKRLKDGKRLRRNPESNRDLREVGLRQQLRGRKRIKYLGVKTATMSEEEENNECYQRVERRTAITSWTRNAQQKPI
jgi:hypothetical protein